MTWVCPPWPHMVEGENWLPNISHRCIVCRRLSWHIVLYCAGVPIRCSIILLHEDYSGPSSIHTAELKPEPVCFYLHSFIHSLTEQTCTGLLPLRQKLTQHKICYKRAQQMACFKRGVRRNIWEPIIELNWNIKVKLGREGPISNKGNTHEGQNKRGSLT